MADTERTAPFEVRASGRTLTGDAIRYRQQATDRPERFEAGAFAPLGDVALNLQHDPAIVLATTGDRLALTDTATALEVRAELRDGAALTLVRRGALRGLSVEFRSLAERRDGGVRVIERASLEGIGLVDSPSYAGRLELRRWRGGSGYGFIRSRIPGGKRLACRCGGDVACAFAEFMGDAVEEMLEEAFTLAAADLALTAPAGGTVPGVGAVAGEGRAATNDLIAAWGSYDRPLASVSRGTLRRSGPDGVEIDLPDDANGRAVLDAHRSTGVIVRPLLDTDASEYEQVGDTMRYTRARVRAFIVSATDQREGWPDPELVAPDAPEPPPEPEGRRHAHRRRVWL